MCLQSSFHGNQAVANFGYFKPKQFKEGYVAQTSAQGYQFGFSEPEHRLHKASSVASSPMLYFHKDAVQTDFVFRFRKHCFAQHLV